MKANHHCIHKRGLGKPRTKHMHAAQFCQKLLAMRCLSEDMCGSRPFPSSEAMFG